MLLDNLFLLMDKLKYYIFILLLLPLQACESRKPVSAEKPDPRLMFGDELLLKSNLEIIRGKHLAVAANKASILPDGTPLLDTLLKIENVKVDVVFTPEHGYNIDASAGKTIYDSSFGSITFYSLYGKNKKPSPEMLQNIDLILFDLQDVGTRFYTYISTLFYIMQAAGENNIPLIILDRPNPIAGIPVEGPVLEPDFQSFVGIAPIPVIYGMTSGELAGLFSGEGMLSSNPRVQVLKMKNWNRHSFFNDYNLKWINPSPNIPDFETALIYPATAFLEGTNISEGRGTDKPFKQIGAPFIKSTDLINELNHFQHEGISIKPVSYTPLSIPRKAENPKYQGILCDGILLNVTNEDELKPLVFSMQLLYALHKLYPERFKFNTAVFDKLMGESHTREMLLMNKTPDEIINSWETGLNKFLKIRTKYLLY